MSAGYPTLAGSWADTNVSGTGTVTCNLPGSIASGDLLILIISRRSSAGVTQTFTTPAGWTAFSGSNILVGPNTSNRYHTQAFYKIASGSEGATVNVVSSLNTTQRCLATAARFTGHDATPVIDFTAESQGASGNWDAPNLNFSAGTWNYTVFAICNQESSVNAIGYPASYSDNQATLEGVASSSTGLRLLRCSRELHASSENPGSGSATSTSWDSLTFGIKSSTSGNSAGTSQVIVCA